MKKKLIVLFAALLLMVGSAFAIDPSGADVTDVNSYGPITSIAAQSTDVGAGNISEINITANMSTVRWAGIFGNVSGNIQLGDGASSNVMYNWVAAGNIVYASEAGAPTWSSLVAETGADIDTALGYMQASDSDSATNTFTGVPESIGSNIFTITAAFATTLGGTTWKTYSLEDGANIVYAGKVDAGQTSYNGIPSDFQMIVPEDGTASDTAATTYNLWVELI